MVSQGPALGPRVSVPDRGPAPSAVGPSCPAVGQSPPRQILAALPARRPLGVLPALSVFPHSTSRASPSILGPSPPVQPLFATLGGVSPSTPPLGASLPPAPERWPGGSPTVLTQVGTARCWIDFVALALAPLRRPLPGRSRLPLPQLLHPR